MKRGRTLQKIFFVSLGCDKNLVDSEIMLGILDEHGYSIATEENEADVIIINTCGFIMDATEEGIETILGLAEQKRDGICKCLIVTGCMAQRYKEEIFKELPEVDAVVGTGDFEKIADVIREIEEGKKQYLIASDKANFSEESAYKRIITTPGHFAYLKIAEGCDNHCTYCTIPSIRGEYRSKGLESLIKEAEILVSKGIKELVLVAQDSTLYGTDLYGSPKLDKLLDELSKIEDLEWIRILYAYPENITQDIIDAMARNEKVCRYIDMPIQHAADTVLKRMGRRSTSYKIEQTVTKLREAMPDIAIRTTIIVGFPGETQQEFDYLKDFILEIGFDRLGAFTYSQEEGTPAAIMENQIEQDIKEQRKQILLETQKHISAKKLLSLVGQTLKVIVEGKLEEENDVYIGRSEKDCYEVDGFVFFKCDSALLTGDFVYVNINEASDYDVIGVVVDELSK